MDEYRFMVSKVLISEGGPYEKENGHNQHAAFSGFDSHISACLLYVDTRYDL